MSASRKCQAVSFLFIACLLRPGVALAAPSITLSKKSGPPTSTILVSGKGFNPNVGLDIYFDTKDEALVVTDGQGTFYEAKIHAPRSAHPGKHWVTALERNNDQGAQKPFLVQTNWSQFHFDADGTRVNPFENVLNAKDVGNLELKWSYPAGDVGTSSPTTANGVVYIGSQDHNVYALSARSGALLWSYRTRDIVATAPAFVDGVVYFSSWDGNVYALNAITGVKLWAFNTGTAVDSSPTVKDGILCVGSEGTNGGVWALNARTGAELWRYTGTGVDGSSPAVANGIVYVGGEIRNIYALDAKAGVPVWVYDTEGTYSSPSVRNGLVYLGWGDGVGALNASDGARVWGYISNGSVLSSPAVDDAAVYFGSYDYNVYAVSASTGAELWSYKTGSYVDSSPAKANGVVYVGSQDGNVYALDAHTGVLLWSYATGNSVYSSPTVANGMVYVGSSDGNIYAFGLPRGNAAKQDAASRRPALNSLRPDLRLKASQPTSPNRGL